MKLVGGVIVCLVIALNIFVWWGVVRVRNQTVESQIKDRLHSIVLGFVSHRNDRGQFPSRSIAQEDGSAHSWRSFLIVEAAPEFKPEQRHPIYCESGNHTNYLAFDYPGAPWGAAEFSGDGSALIFVHVDEATIPWKEAGDVVLGMNAVYPLDIDQDAFKKLPASKFLVGRLDGTSLWMTKDEIVSSVSRNAR
jgi:hypothetical protein